MFLIGEKAQSPYAMVWSVEEKGNFVKGRISTSEKDNRNEGKFINSNWFATFVGKAKDKAVSLSEKDKIKITSGKVTNTTTGDEGNKKTYCNVTIFDFEVIGSPVNNTPDTYDDSDDNLPF